jgi:putative flippase GtrA
MTALRRWLRFNLVGAMGMALQLAALALLRRLRAGVEMYACAAAVELAVLHNFFWHLHYTWRDRRTGAPWWRKLMRFHLSNGAVSMAGNLALLRLLTRAAHLPLLLADGVAVLCCSVANFCLAHVWAFAKPQKTRKRQPESLHTRESGAA